MAGASRDLAEPIVIEQKANVNVGPHGPLARVMSTGRVTAYRSK